MSIHCLNTRLLIRNHPHTLIIAWSPMVAPGRGSTDVVRNIDKILYFHLPVNSYSSVSTCYKPKLIVELFACLFASQMLVPMFTSTYKLQLTIISELIKFFHIFYNFKINNLDNHVYSIIFFCCSGVN